MARIKSFVFFSQSGCLLPALIIFNLFFGWLFLKPKAWLILESILLVIFILKGFIAVHKIATGSSRHDDAIDVKGEVVEERHKLK